jgi:hypothetical protein
MPRNHTLVAKRSPVQAIIDSTERRRAGRYGINLPTVFTWRDAAGVVLHGCGFTRDISVVGVFVATRAQLPVGAGMQLEICLPGLDCTVHGRLVGEACVVRFEDTTPEGGGLGFAAACSELNLQWKEVSLGAH